MTLQTTFLGLHTNDPRLPILSRDPSIDPRTRGLLDFGSRFVYPSGDNPVPAGQSFRDLVRNVGDSTLSVSQAYGGNGIAFTGLTTQRILLPSAYSVPAATKHFALTIWAKLLPSGYNTGAAGTVSYSVGGLRESATTQYMMALGVNRETGSLSTVNFTANGAPTVLFGEAATDGDVHQLTGEFQVLPDGNAQVCRTYIDGVLSREGFANAYPGSVVQPNVPAILGRVSTSYLGSLRGSIYRASLQLLDGEGRSLVDILAADYERNSARFS